MQDMIMIDNHNSVVGMIGTEGNDQSVVLRNIKFYGETEASECPGEPNICQTRPYHRGCFQKSAIMPSSYAGHSKKALVDSKPVWPQYKIKADASFGGVTTYENMQFFNFNSAYSYCGMQ